jgi:hypothetical protein
VSVAWQYEIPDNLPVAGDAVPDRSRPDRSKQGQHPFHGAILSGFTHLTTVNITGEIIQMNIPR